MRKQLLAAAGGGSVIAAGWLARRYRHDLDAARARLAAVDRTVIQTASGPVEYAERGTGGPLLAIHAIFGGCDQALLSVDGPFPGRRVIAPSRFGYLGSALPPSATPPTRPMRSPRCSITSRSPVPTWPPSPPARPRPFSSPCATPAASATWW